MGTRTPISTVRTWCLPFGLSARGAGIGNGLAGREGVEPSRAGFGGPAATVAARPSKKRGFTWRMMGWATGVEPASARSQRALVTGRVRPPWGAGTERGKAPRGTVMFRRGGPSTSRTWVFRSSGGRYSRASSRPEVCWRMEPTSGIEPDSAVYETAALPLSYAGGGGSGGGNRTPMRPVNSRLPYR